MTFKVATQEDIEAMIAAVIGREGGDIVTNHPNDEGKWTKYGVSQGALGDYLGLTRDANEAEIRALTLETATQIYRIKYYQRYRIGRLPFDMQEPVLDSCVTSGGHGIKQLQRLINRLLKEDGIKPLLQVDGGLGNKTLDQVAVYFSRNEVAFRDFYSLTRVGFFIHIATIKASRRVFIKGWITKRANPFISKERRFKMSNLKKYADWA